MAKKKQLTEEEILKKERDNGLFLIKDTIPHLNEPTYKFNVGDKVKFGALKESIVKEILYDDKIYVLDCIATNENYGRPYDYRTIRVCKWTDIRPLKHENTDFTKNKDIRLFFNNSSIESLIFKYYDFGINMNPKYQRDYVWSEEDEENLLDSIFNNIDIGKFVFICLDSDEWSKTGYEYEILDGKQRLNTIIKFYENRIPYKGKYYNDLSGKDKATFKGLRISIAEIKKDILRYFVMLNTTGKVMDKEHIDKVKEMIGE